MIGFGLSLAGERRVELRLEQFPERFRARLRGEITAITGELEAAVTAGEPRRSGKLQSETRSFVDERVEFIRGRVKVVTRSAGKAEGGKAAALEYGAHGASPVKAHARVLSQVYGRMIAPMSILVDAHDRTLDIAARHYLRGPLAAKRAEIMARLRAAANETVAEA